MGGGGEGTPRGGGGEGTHRGGAKATALAVPLPLLPLTSSIYLPLTNMSGSSKYRTASLVTPPQ